MQSIDLNCDMGESFGAYTIGNDESLMDYVTSVNIACGFHAGDPSVMRKVVRAAVVKGVAIGAHPGYPDLQGFGRRELRMQPDEVCDMILYQVAALYGFVKAEGGTLTHVKPHGALYNMAAKDRLLADAIAKAVSAFDSNLMLIGLSGSALIAAGKAFALRTVSEVFADRSYQRDGTLTPRTSSNALITDDQEAINQVLSMVQKQVVMATDGSPVSIIADSICIHGDGEHALSFARKINSTLKMHGVAIKSPQ